VLGWWGLESSNSAFPHFVLILSKIAAASGDTGFDPLHRIPQVVLLEMSFHASSVSGLVNTQSPLMCRG
jgi:hypothetical protein